jgi:hypothetical protein
MKMNSSVSERVDERHARSGELGLEEMLEPAAAVHPGAPVRRIEGAAETHSGTRG